MKRKKEAKGSSDNVVEHVFHVFVTDDKDGQEVVKKFAEGLFTVRRMKGFLNGYGCPKDKEPASCSGHAPGDDYDTHVEFDKY